MAVSKRGSINIFVLVIMFIILGGISILIYQYGRQTETNQMFYIKNQSMQMALAVEEKFLSNYTELNLGHFDGIIEDGRYCVSISEHENKKKIFIIVEYSGVPFTIEITLDNEGQIEKRLDNVPKGETLCW
ncbi:hypothetical protein HYG86_15640 [Alkalicella caledoniensis]|uniref:Uncharacterized protein n=1 Tax=Alkalicella caledoniensis TaxID=2731377 RepID=A0A7G9WBN5_ALKCA|nr:hypothetical protein [Alkalicella caledoniensis]QNO16097.1 hypothetical protein HYG86_15640 [Alkalicella caledoniensis]